MPGQSGLRRGAGGRSGISPYRSGPASSNDLGISSRHEPGIVETVSRWFVFIVGAGALACHAGNAAYDARADEIAATGAIETGTTADGMTSGARPGDAGADETADDGAQAETGSESESESGPPIPENCAADLYGASWEEQIWLLDVDSGTAIGVGLKDLPPSDAIATHPNGTIYVSDRVNPSRVFNFEPIAFLPGDVVTVPTQMLPMYYARATFVGGDIVLGPEGSGPFHIFDPVDPFPMVASGPTGFFGTVGDMIPAPPGVGTDALWVFDDLGDVHTIPLDGSMPPPPQAIIDLPDPAITGAARDRDGRVWISAIAGSDTWLYRLGMQGPPTVVESVRFENAVVHDLAPIFTLPGGC